MILAESNFPKMFKIQIQNLFFFGEKNRKIEKKSKSQNKTIICKFLIEYLKKNPQFS